jgi:hypothetical protein
MNGNSSLAPVDPAFKDSDPMNRSLGPVDPAFEDVDPKNFQGL